MFLHPVQRVMDTEEISARLSSNFGLSLGITSRLYSHGKEGRNWTISIPVLT